MIPEIFQRRISRPVAMVTLVRKELLTSGVPGIFENENVEYAEN